MFLNIHYDPLKLQLPLKNLFFPAQNEFKYCLLQCEESYKNMKKNQSNIFHMYLASCFLTELDNQTNLAILLTILEIDNNFFWRKGSKEN